MSFARDEQGFCQALTLLGGHSGMSITVWNDRSEGTPRVDTYDTTIAMIH